ncbi:DUF1918 domain-containing protein [Paraeggerthella hongkongensis]|uniref:Uncharacterized protein n=1 Tax=Paraeggerthella hongkongensis TaxID=230658 RepID=A0A3N0BH41_9ACTN|nr:DUF1918 domain-containing protein [Paraeggerthella hongkongensis]RNL46888.1 hypothetical protein DMP08_04190 [Paraeggerthella hongkongensis]
MNDDERLEESVDEPDAALGDALFRAFDRMTPSAEVEERMLKAIAPTCETPSNENEGEDECEDEEPHSHLEDCDASNRAFVPATVVLGKNGANTESYRKARRVWNVSVPAAACLVLAVGIGGIALGVSGTAQQGMQAAAPNEGGTTSMSSAEAARSADAVPTPETGAGPAANAAPHLNVVLSDGLQLRIASGEDGLPLAADPALVGDQIEVASAWTDSQERVGCTVFAYGDGAHPYAVRYDGDESFYVASAV